MKLAFLGMGLMGAPMARNLIKAGHEVTVWNRTAAKCAPLEQAGARLSATPALAAQGQAALLLCVDDHLAVEQVLFGPDGVAEGIKASPSAARLVIDHSTISPVAENKLAVRLLAETGAQLIDIPVTGGDVGAKAGTLTMMAGGPPESFAQARPFLAAMGTTLEHIGPAVGDGQRCKLINQALIITNLLSTLEAARIGESLGMDMRRVFNALANGSAGSMSMRQNGPKWLDRDFAPGFRLRHLLKDIRYAREMIEDGGGRLDDYPALALGLALLERACAAGFGDGGIPALGRIFLKD